MSRPYSTVLTMALVCITVDTTVTPVLFATKVSTACLQIVSMDADIFYINRTCTVLQATITLQQSLHYVIDGKVRLVNNIGSAASGQVEISVNGEWGTVCDNAWNLDDATVVCRQLGYDGAWTAHYQPGSGLVKVEDPQCSGEEVTLLDCWTAQSNGGGMFCSHGRDVAVECMTSPSGMHLYDCHLNIHCAYVHKYHHKHMIIVVAQCLEICRT